MGNQIQNSACQLYFGPARMGELNDYIKNESENLWNSLGNVILIALDMYDKKAAVTREDAAKYMCLLTTDRGEAIITGAPSPMRGQKPLYAL